MFASTETISDIHKAIPLMHQCRSAKLAVHMQEGNIRGFSISVFVNCVTFCVRQWDKEKKNEALSAFALVFAHFLLCRSARPTMKQHYATYGEIHDHRYSRGSIGAERITFEAQKHKEARSQRPGSKEDTAGTLSRLVHRKFSEINKTFLPTRDKAKTFAARMSGVVLEIPLKDFVTIRRET